MTVEILSRPPFTHWTPTGKPLFIYSHFFQRKNRYGPIAAQTISIIDSG
jgi:hypothetical protein